MNAKKVFSTILIINLLCIFNVFALTRIPGTEAERLSYSKQLEADWQTKKQPADLRNLAIVQGVIASSDQTLSTESLDKALSLFEQAKAVLPEQDAEFMAAMGSILTRRALFTKELQKKLHYSKQGTRILDRAVKKSPQDFGARLYRGNNSLNLPKVLGRMHLAIQDFEVLLGLLNNTALLQKEKLPAAALPNFKAMVLYRLGSAYALNEKPSEAKKFWQQADRKSVV